MSPENEEMGISLEAACFKMQKDFLWESISLSGPDVRTYVPLCGCKTEKLVTMLKDNSILTIRLPLSRVHTSPFYAVSCLVSD